MCGSNFYESDVTMVLRSENGLETKSQERLYRPFTERRSDNPTGLDELLDMSYL